jgi:hypothetical protein
MVAGTKLTPSALKAAKNAVETAVRGAERTGKHARLKGEKIRERAGKAKDAVKSSVRSKRERPSAGEIKTHNMGMKTFAKKKMDARMVEDD